MPLIKIFNTSSFRLTLIYLALFSVSVVVLLGYVYWSTAGALVRQTDEVVQEEIQTLAGEYRRGGLPLLTSAVAQLSRDSRLNLYLLVAPPDRILAGNLDEIPALTNLSDGWLEFRYRRPQNDSETVHIARARVFDLAGGYSLLVGRDINQQHTLETLITNALFWAVALTVAFGLAGGIIISRESLTRIDAINRTSRRIMKGALSDRLPVLGVRDEIDQLSENVNAMLDQIELLMSSMREVTDNVAHDLRSPLTRMRNRLEVALLNDPDGEAYREVLEKTITETDSLLHTFNALLSIARLESGALREEKAWIDVAGLLQDDAELYAPAAEEKNRGLVIEAPTDLKVFGNRELLSQAVVNLIENALRYGAPGASGGDAGRDAGREVRVGARCEERNETPCIVLSVRDRGAGIAEADRQRVLDRFVRLEKQRNTPGSGLGLSLVQAIARHHGGSVCLEDNAPGLRILLVLPQPPDRA